jgi:uncharacterized damage-inducible protein DinB
MNADALIRRMHEFPERLSALLAGLPPEDLRWRPKPRQWSILEIVNHLTDIEVEDMRTRLRLTLEDPEQNWPTIDPQTWAVERKYQDRDFDESLNAFIAQRGRSIEYLRGLEAPDWTMMHTHPTFGSMRAGDLLAAWSAHDVLHTRQIVKRLFQFTSRDARGFSTDYAGTWLA